MAAALLSAASLAGASTITFNEYAFDGYYAPVAPVTSGGFSFTNSAQSYGGADALGVWGRNDPSQADWGNAAIFVNYGYTTTTMTRIGGGNFDFTSIDLADVYNLGSSVTLQFTFNYAAGGFASQSVTLDNSPGLQTFAFNQSGLSSVDWVTTGGANGWNQFDNVVVDANTAPVPEPETYAMMMAGIGVLGAVARRRKQAAPSST